MREILFRAKETFNGEWVEGYYEFGYDAETEEPTHYMWVLNHTEKYGDMFMVIPETIGQYTGLTDKNGKKIFEGDIVKIKTINGDMIATIVYRKGFFIADSGRSIVNLGIGTFKKQQIKIIGNIHDNPELLKYESEGEG